MFKVLNFFKSYKVDILNTNTIYKFDDKLENKIKMIDDIFFRYLFTRTDRVDVDDFINALNVHLEPNERITPEDKIYMDIYRWANKIFKDKMEYYDEIANILIAKICYDWGNLQWDGIWEYKYLYDKKIVIPVDDHIVDNNVYLTLNDYVQPESVMYKDIV